MTDISHEPASDEQQHAPKTIEAYAQDRAKLNALKAPVKFAFASSGIDLEYRRDQKVEYLLGMVGHLLKRVEALEAELASGRPQGSHAQ